MANALINSKTESVRISSILTVKQVDQGTLYSSIIAGTQLLPPSTLVRLIATGGSGSIRLTGDVEQTWATSQNLGFSGAASTAIAGLSANATATATDLPTVIALSNSLKTSVNAIISALKS